MFRNRKFVIFIVWLIIIAFFLSTILTLFVYADEGTLPPSAEASSATEEEWRTITISAAGDVTLGRDAQASYNGSFDHEVVLQKSNYSYFMRNVQDYFKNDDLTIVNLEGALTNASIMADKQYRFKGLPSYTEVLKQGHIEAVSLANNHVFDYLDQGYWDTVSSLSAAGIGYFGNEHIFLQEIQGIKVGILGFTGWDSSKVKKDEIKKAVEKLKNQGAKLIIASFHWGEERKYTPNQVQKELGRYSIDVGVDLVLGHHPHVVQGIEVYKGKSIVYSMGNFCFGGNKNPSDKDAFIYQHSFSFYHNELQEETGQVIPISVSSQTSRNNYQPTPLQGIEAERVINKIMKYSRELQN